MSHRAAVIAVALFVPIGAALAPPFVVRVGSVPVALASGTPADDLTDENSPPDQQQAPAPAPVPASPPAHAPATTAPAASGQPPAAATPPPAPAPAHPSARISLPPKPADTLTDDGTRSGSRGSSAGSRHVGSPNGTKRNGGLWHSATVAQSTSVRDSGARPIAEVSTVPRGAGQAGGGGSAAVHDISRRAVVGAAAALAVIAAGSGLLLRRRRRLASELSYRARSRAC